MGLCCSKECLEKISSNFGLCIHLGQLCKVEVECELVQQTTLRRVRIVAYDFAYSIEHYYATHVFSNPPSSSGTPVLSDPSMYI